MTITRTPWRSLLLAVVLVSAGCGSVKAARSKAPAPSVAPTGDPILDAMATELTRSSTRLALDDYKAPYFVAYAVKESRGFSLGGKLGAVYADEDKHARHVYVDVRVGDYSFDSSEDPEGHWMPEGVYEPSTLAPLGDKPQALRHALWLLTDVRYKQALSSYLKLKGQLVYEAKKRERPSFSPAAPLRQLDPPIEPTADRARWRALVKTLGAELAKDTKIFDSEIQVELGVETRWLVNTEGARVRTMHPMYAVHVLAYTIAPDGMVLDQSFSAYAPTEAALADDATLLQRTKRLMVDLAALRAAPVLEPFTGPAILEPAATGVFFHEVLGHRLEGHRQDDNEEGQTFAAHLGKRILPEFISVFDDPSMLHHKGRPLNGAYLIDDEGVKAATVTLVDRGVLKGFLMPRKPVKGFKSSNGHGRAQGVQRPVARMGNLVVKAHATVPRARLKEMLLAEAKRQGKRFGLLVRDITGGATNTSSYGYQAFKGEARMVYKVDVDTGQESLVRGVEIVGTPLVSIGKIVAASDETGVFNGYCGAESGNVPVSTIAPATMFSEIELQRTARVRSRAPILPLPAGPRELQR